ncbi:MAG: exosortase system-associated hydrolase 1 [Firmicutes bacterium]|nr:exosortase system-associated hydrolase 1 [Bacillota bacterium]
MRDHIWLSSRKKRLSLMVHRPAGFAQGTPVVILCHGFTADKIGANQLTKNLADFIEQLGYGVVRFDYAGSGDSEGDFASDTSVAGWRQDLESILRWVHEQADFKQSPIVLYGHSLGGLVVLTHPADDTRIVARIAFAPVTQAVENFRDIIFGQDLWQQALQGESIKNFYGRAFTLNPQFVEDLVANTYNPTENLVGTEQPMLFIHGTADDVVPLAGTQVVYAAYSGQKELAITDFDHVAAGQQNELQQIIRKWLADQFPRE